jgi:hypothetical protein
MKNIQVSMEEEKHRDVKILCATYNITMRDFMDNAINSEISKYIKTTNVESIRK